MIKILNRFLEGELIEPEEIHEIYKGEPKERLEFLNALIALRRNPRCMEDFYLFNNIILALNYKEVDFHNFFPANAEEMWNGIEIIHSMFPYIKFSGEVKLYIKRILNDDGIYFYPSYIEESKSLSDIKDKAETGPFPLNDDDMLSYQASKYMALNTYHKVEVSKDFSWIKKPE